MNDEHSKTQIIRLIDVFVLGPFLIAAGYRARTALYQRALILSGVATILYNGRNYLRNLT